MKKIFLTSGLVLCLACPALATTDISGSANSASCVEDTLGVDSGSTSFEAKWTAKTYNITYGCGTGTGTTSVTGNPEHPIYGETYIFPSLATGCSKTGYHVTSWNCGQSFGGDHLVGSSITWNYDMSGNPVATTCAANWTANATDITYSCGNGATGTPATPLTGNALYGESYTYTTVGTCAKSGYAFAGWDCGETGYTNKAANSTETWSYTGDHGGSMTCTAIWNASYTITYAAGGTCTGNGYSEIPSVGNTYAFLNPASAGVVVPSGSTFTGWSCNQNLGTKSLGDTVTWNVNANVTCTAQCSANSITLNYSANCGNSGDTNCTSWLNDEDASCSFGSTFDLPTQPTKKGYTFTGWTVSTPTNPLLTKNASTLGTNGGWDGGSIGENGYDQNGSTYGLTVAGTWAVPFSYGTVWGTSKCSVTSGTFGNTGTPSDTSGYHCWCKVNAFTPTNGSKQSITTTPWVYLDHEPVNEQGQNEDCYGYCASTCAYLGVANGDGVDGANWTTFRARAYGQSQ